MRMNYRKIVGRSVFMGVGTFVLLSLWDWIESGNSRLLANAIIGVVTAFVSAVVDKTWKIE